VVLVLSCAGLPQVLEAGYAAFKELLQGSTAAFGEPETAIGADRSDCKRYLEFGSEERADIPKVLRELRQMLCRIVDERSDELEVSLLREAGSPLAKLLDRRRGPVLRLSWYPGGPIGPVNHPHTDIDLFTILPASTRPGLEFRSRNRWEGVGIGPSEVLVLPGELLQYFGGLSPVEHRVMGDGSERVSASLFVNADPSLDVEGHGRVAGLFEARLAAVRRTSNNEGA
jgi:hypothetical protein